ncbi:MAG: SpoIIE family protein phosphatase [Acidobacteria bacterium]|nr:SpoIIE family protein phosphatase [Acidobacteriota bacterium]
MDQVLNDRHKSRIPLNEIEILRSTIYHLNEGVIVADKEGVFLICNEAAQSVLEIGVDDRSPKSWNEICGCYMPDGVTLYEPEALPAARALAGETVPETEIYIRNEQCPGGIWIHAKASPLKDANENICGSVVVFHDATKRKQTDAHIKTLTNAVEQTADGIMICDRSGQIEYVNPAFTEITGYSLEEVQGLTPRILKSGVHDDAFYEKLWATILSGNVFRGTIANRKKNGEIFFAEQTITPMLGSTGAINHLVTVIKDVTEQKKLREQKFQMSLARAVQQQFYRMPPPKIKGYKFAGFSFPADETGGDYFDFLPLPGDVIGIATGDVSGHGIGSALLMVELRAFLRAFAQQGANVGDIFSLMNNALASDLEQGRFATLILCFLDTSARSFLYASAGHTPGYILDTEGNVKQTLKSTDIPLGFMPDHKFTCSDRIQLESGDILALLTDGITEAERPDQEAFGIERTLDYIRAHRHEHVQLIINGLYKAVRDFSDGMPQVDDITAVLCKVE